MKKIITLVFVIISMTHTGVNAQEDSVKFDRNVGRAPFRPFCMELKKNDTLAFVTKDTFWIDTKSIKRPTVPRVRIVSLKKTDSVERQRDSLLFEATIKALDSILFLRRDMTVIKTLSDSIRVKLEDIIMLERARMSLRRDVEILLKKMYKQEICVDNINPKKVDISSKDSMHVISKKCFSVEPKPIIVVDTIHAKK